jgi:sialate O-acetylesterase
MRLTLLFLLSILVTGITWAQPKPANIFGSHMVFQRNKPIRIWGKASPGENITVTMAGKSGKAKAGQDGRWEAVLPPMTHGGPYTMSIKGNREIKLDDILVGEVWLCSGQSNMEWTLRNTDNAEAEIARASLPMIRHIKVPNRTSFKPETEIGAATWQVCSPASAGDFTAVGYYFAKKLWEEMGIPVGLVNASWGGTQVESWISGQSFFASPEFAPIKSSMPANMDLVIRNRQAQIDKLIRETQGRLPTPAEAAKFSAAGYDHLIWKTMKLPDHWENQGLKNIDGVVWFRKEFQVPADISLANAVLNLSMIDDIDSTYLNGQLIGSTNMFNKPRSYQIPPGLLKSRNVIAVKVRDNAGAGGIYGDPANMVLRIGLVSVPLDGEWRYRVEQVFNTANGIGPNDYPTVLYNALINPIVRFPLRGAIWYQGETNAGRAEQYRRSFPMMIEDWRKRWKDELPFYFVQLTHFYAGGGNSSNGGSTWAELREAQQKTLRLPNTGMAVITDIGNSQDIHPRNKSDVGKRLAAQALAKTYGKKIPCESPYFASMEKQGNRVVVRFDHIYDGWNVKSQDGSVNGFEVAGEDRKFYPARAWVMGKDIIVESTQVSNPASVRYCWSDDPNNVNLFNSIGFPAAPFRTDDWPMLTQGVKFSIGR